MQIYIFEIQKSTFNIDIIELISSLILDGYLLPKYKVQYVRVKIE